jgi:hypothetical protein
VSSEREDGDGVGKGAALVAAQVRSQRSCCSRLRPSRNAPVLMTTPILHIEFFDRANQFRHAYRTLPNSGQLPEWPKYVLFYHAMELALKAYLIQRGVSEKDLKVKFGHDIKKLVHEAVNRGLSLPQGSKEMIAELGGRPPTASQATVPPHLRIRYPLDAQVYSLGQFEPYMVHLFTAVASALGMSTPSNPLTGR